jgi:hypothetical protein
LPLVCWVALLQAGEEALAWLQVTGVEGLPEPLVAEPPSGAAAGLFSSATVVPLDIRPRDCWTQTSEACTADIEMIRPIIAPEIAFFVRVPTRII